MGQGADAEALASAARKFLADREVTEPVEVLRLARKWSIDGWRAVARHELGDDGPLPLYGDVQNALVLVEVWAHAHGA